MNSTKGVFESLDRRRNRQRSRTLLLRGAILIVLALYALVVPAQFMAGMFPAIGATMIAVGVLGIMALTSSSGSNLHLVLELIGCTLGILGGLAVIGGTSIVRLAPENMLLCGLALAFLLAAFLQIVFAASSHSTPEKFAGLFGAAALAALSGVVFTASWHQDYELLARFGGGILLAMGLTAIVSSSKSAFMPQSRPDYHV